MANHYHVTIETNPASFTRSKLGTIAGEVYLRLDEAFFPEEKWSDMPISLLSDWSKKALSLARGHSQCEDFYFLDGPFSFEIFAAQNEVWCLRLIGRHVITCPNSHALDCVGQSTLDRMEFLPVRFMESLRIASNDAVRQCLRMQWRGREVASLEENLRKLQSPV